MFFNIIWFYCILLKLLDNRYGKIPWWWLPLPGIGDEHNKLCFGALAFRHWVVGGTKILGPVSSPLEHSSVEQIIWYILGYFLFSNSLNYFFAKKFFLLSLLSTVIWRYKYIMITWNACFLASLAICHWLKLQEGRVIHILIRLKTTVD